MTTKKKMEQSKSRENLEIPSNHHQTEADEEDDNVKQLQECSFLYLSLQDCLAQTNRNWKSCQLEVQALKACHERRQNGRGK